MERLAFERGRPLPQREEESLKVQKNMEKLGSDQLPLISVMIWEGTGGKLEKNGKDLECRIRPLVVGQVCHLYL